ncbi:uncharacterized protein LOC134268165 [Saccostrea cucullata]|uniref:uncharacterized protein LOC134268165 n=1 Tax=Saccostrea cuccullata TaxID=36930 RepID=UPI002ED2230D
MVLDDIFYDLQSEDEIQAVIKEVEELFDTLCSSKSLYTTITIYEINDFFFSILGNAHQKVPTSEHDKREEDFILSNLNDTSKDTYTRAGNCLTLKRFVVLRGVQGSGKTYLAKKLAGNINQISKTECQVHWLNDVLENKIPSLTTKTLIVLDDIFYELQSEDEIQTVIKEVEELYDNVCSSKSLFTIMTIPTLVWKRNSDNFQNKRCLRIYVDLDTLSTEERMDILHEHLNRSAIKDEGIQTKGKLMMREIVKSAIINFERYDYIGYPSCVAWISRMQNQFDLHDAGRFIEVPITRIKSEIYRLSNAKNIKERKMFLLLAFMAFNDGKLNVRKLSENLMEFARILFPDDNCRDLTLLENDSSVFCLQEKYIRYIYDGIYEFYLDVVRKIVFVAALEKDVEALKKKVSQYMWKRFVVQKATLPADLKNGELTHMFVKL